jgi:hypothetical protein
MNLMFVISSVFAVRILRYSNGGRGGILFTSFNLARENGKAGAAIRRRSDVDTVP